MEHPASNQTGPLQDQEPMVIGVPAKSATRCALSPESGADAPRPNSSPRPHGRTTISALKRDVGRGHAAVRDALASSVVAAKKTGDLLQELKGRVPRGEWGQTLDQLAAEYGLTKRTAQFYMQTAKKWEEISQEHPALADYSLRVVQRLLAKPRADKKDSDPTDQDEDDPGDDTSPVNEGTGDNIDMPVVRQAVLAYFSSRIDVEATSPADGTSDSPSASGQQGNLSSLPVEWSGNVFCKFLSAAGIHDAVIHIIAAFATESIDEALLLLPSRLNGPWIRLLDPYPRVFLDESQGFQTSSGSQSLMLVGLIRHERALEFHSAFKNAGSVFYPITFLFEGLES